MRPPTAGSEATHAGMDRGRIGGDLTCGVARDWSERLAMPVVDAPLTIVSMVAPADVAMYVLSMKAFYRRLGRGRLVAIIDRDTPAAARRMLEHHFPGMRAQQTIDELDHRRFPTAVRPHDARYRAMGKCRRQTRDERFFSVGEDNVAHIDGRRLPAKVVCRTTIIRCRIELIQDPASCSSE